MADKVETTKTLHNDGTKTVQTTTTPQNAKSKDNTATRIVSFIFGTIIVLIVLRFLMVLLGASEGNAIIDALYSITQPLVMPFFGIFNYDVSYGQSQVEFASLVAMLAYWLVGIGILKLITIKR